MAKRSAQDTAAAKAKKQKMILIVGGVLLLAVAAFQVPKLMKGGGSTAAPASTVAGAAVAGTPVAGTPVPVAVAAVPTKGSAVDRGRFPAARRGRQGRDEPARLVHALRGQGSIRPAGRRRGDCRRLVLQPERCSTSGRHRRRHDGHGYVGRLHRRLATGGFDAGRTARAHRSTRRSTSTRSRSRFRSRARSRRPSHCSSSAR